MTLTIEDHIAKTRTAIHFADQCCEAAFKAFLQEKHGMGSMPTDDAAVAFVVDYLGLRSPGELHGNEAAIAQWQQLRSDFQEWRAS